MLLDCIDREEKKHSDAANASQTKKIDLREIPSLAFAFALLNDLQSGAVDVMDVQTNGPVLDGSYHFNVHMFRRGSGHLRKRDLIQRVIFNDPATIVYWNDGTKTVVKCGENEPFDPEKGLAMAITKKMLGNKGNYYDTLKKWLPDPEELHVDDKMVERVVCEAYETYMADLSAKTDTLRKSLKKLGALLAGNGDD